MSFLARWLGRGEARSEATGDPVRVAAVEATLERLRPMLRADGGDVRLVAIDEAGDVELEWRGACAHCPVSRDTLDLGLEPALRADHAWVRAVRVR